MSAILKLEAVRVSMPIRSGNLYLLKNRLLGKKNSNFEILKCISLQLHPGDRVGIVGNNGAGKTTLLRVLCGVMPVTSGKVISKGTILPLLNINSRVYNQLTCLENIKLYGLRHQLKDAQLLQYINHVVEISGLDEFIDSPVRILSAGMRNRLVLAMLYADKSDIVIMDEWIGASDQRVLKSKEGLLHDLIESSEIFILASHREKVIRDHCNKILHMENGQIKNIEEI